MNQLVSKSIVTDAQFRIKGGIHPQEYKSLSNQQPIASIQEPPFYILPYSDLNKGSTTTQLEIAQPVEQGQVLINSELANLSSVVHSPCDGVIADISEFDLGHPSGLEQPAIKIQAMPKSELEPTAHANSLTDQIDYLSLTNEQLITRVHQAGIVGLGGAGFPTHIKLSAAKDSIHTLIVNAMECEPYITCDDRLLREHPQSVLKGALIAAKTVSANRILFGIEDNKPEAIAALKTAIENYFNELTTTQESLEIKIIIAKTKYPSGGEKQIIELLTGQQVPKGQLPSSLGILVQNVATLEALNKAINQRQVMTKRLVTITGNLVGKPGNYWIPFGTPVSHIAEQLEVNLEQLACFIFGGPLMGTRHFNLEIPTKKSTNCIIFDSAYKTLEYPAKHQECIRCGECELACPMNLVPQQLYWFAKSQQWEALEEQQLFSCIDCAACSYVCPSEIPLVSYYQFAKSEIKDIKNKQIKSELAKARFDNREKRLARIKAEREEKRRKAAEARQLAAANKTNDPDGKKSAIEAALQRVKAKKENKP